jgi:hypothetical protein
LDEAEEARERGGGVACGCAVVAIMAALGLGLLVVLAVFLEPIQEIWHTTTSGITEPDGYRTSTFSAWQTFDCGRTDCPWKYRLTDDLVVVQQRANASLMHPDGYEHGAEVSNARITMACVRGRGSTGAIEVYVFFELPAPRRVRDRGLVSVMSDRDRRPGDDILTFRSGLADPLRSYRVPAAMVTNKAGEFQLVFEEDSMITDWLNAWSLWVIAPLSDGWKAGAIFDLLHSTRHSGDMMYWCE